MLVLGVDPGTALMGVGAVRACGDEYMLVLSDALRPPRNADLSERLCWLHARMAAVVSELRPDVVAVEAPFVGRSVKAALAVGQAQAVAMIAAAGEGIPVFTYAPGAVKKAVTDHGGSSKRQVQDMVQAMLELDDPLDPPDRADALAVAICHLNSTRADQFEMWE